MKHTNKFIETIRQNVKNGNIIKNFPCGNWDILNREQRMFLLECADYMEMLEKELAVRCKMLEILLKDKIEQEEQLLIEYGIVEDGVLSDEDYEITLKEYRERVEELARKELESKDEV